MNNRQMLDDRSFIEPTRERVALPDRPEPPRPAAVRLNLDQLCARWDNMPKARAEVVITLDNPKFPPCAISSSHNWWQRDSRTWSLSEVERFEETVRTLCATLAPVAKTR